jgi:hypothetical protein
MSIQQANGSINLQAKLNDLVKAGTVDPNILLKYSQNPPPDLGDKGALLVSLASSIVARNKAASNASMPAPTETVSEQVQNKLAQSDQPQGIASLNPSSMMPPEMMAQAPQMPQAPTEMMAEGGVADLNVGNMFNEANYANGGIVAFAAGDLVNDTYKSFRMPVPAIPTADDLLLETQDLKSRFVDPDFYKKRKQDLEAQTLEDIKESRESDKANILFKLAEGFGTTPGGFVRGAVAAGVKAGPAVAEMNKNIIAAKRLNRAALNELEQAKYAESVGDFKTAAALKESAKTKAFEADKVNATTGATIEAANIKAAAKTTSDTTKREDMIKINAAKLGEQMFINAYPAGSVSNILGDDPGFIQFVRNLYTKNVENYLRDRSAAPIPSENQMRQMYDNYLKDKNKASTTSSKPAENKKPASKLSGADSPLAATRPSMPLLNKYPSRGSRSTNTDEELQLTNPIYDNMGDQDDEYSQ